MIKNANIGCGNRPIVGWLNYDNTPAIRIANSPIKYFLLRKLKLINSLHIKNIEWNKRNKIKFADVRNPLPFQNNEIQCIYSCHMLEHLSKETATFFLKECLRSLSPKGILRIVVPDLRQLVDSYILNGDADLFYSSLHITPPPIDTPRDKLKLLLIGGYRQHQCLYDSKSLKKILLKIGFEKVIEQAPGNTCIKNYGELNLSERSDESSLYIEASK